MSSQRLFCVCLRERLNYGINLFLLFSGGGVGGFCLGYVGMYIYMMAHISDAVCQGKFVSK